MQSHILLILKNYITETLEISRTTNCIEEIAIEERGEKSLPRLKKKIQKELGNLKIMDWSSYKRSEGRESSGHVEEIESKPLN